MVLSVRQVLIEDQWTIYTHLSSFGFCVVFEMAAILSPLVNSFQACKRWHSGPISTEGCAMTLYNAPGVVLPWSFYFYRWFVFMQQSSERECREADLRYAFVKLCSSRKATRSLSGYVTVWGRVYGAMHIWDLHSDLKYANFGAVACLQSHEHALWWTVYEYE